MNLNSGRDFPERRTRVFARSVTRTGSPMSSTRMSPFRPIAKAGNTRLTASEIVMKKRVISG